MVTFKKLGVVLVVVMALVLGVSAVSAQGPEQADHPRARALVGAGSLVNAMADLAGLDLADMRDDLQAGVTLNDVAADLGLDPAAVVDAAAATLTERIETAVSAGRMTQEEADGILATLSDDLTALMAEPLPERPVRDRIEDGVRELRGAHYLMEALSDATGLSAADIVTQMRDEGLTAAEIAAANGVDPQAVIDAAVAAATADLQTQLDGLGDQFSDLMDQTLPERPLDGRPGPGGRGPRGGQGNNNAPAGEGV